MTAGLSAANLANKWLDMLGATAFTAPAAFWVQVHTADPGASGTTAASANVTGRKQVTWSAASAGSKSEASSPSAWSATGSDTITHVSFWDASTSGNFLGSAALSVSRSVINGDTLTLTTLTIALTPIAA